MQALLFQRVQFLSDAKVATIADDIFLLFKSRRRRVEKEKDEFYHTFVKWNRAYNKGDSYGNTRIVAAAVIFENVKEQKERAPDKQRNVEKLWWSEVYQNCSDHDFKSEMRLNLDTFNYILDSIHDQIVLTPTNLKPNPTPPHW